jgi:hypothetical protein
MSLTYRYTGEAPPKRAPTKQKPILGDILSKRQLKPGLGIQKSGWGKPVPLLGLTKEAASQIKSSLQSKGITKSIVKNMDGFRNRTVDSFSIPGRFFSDQTAWMAAAEAQQELQKYRLQPEDPAWEFVDQIGSVVSTGLNYINPLLGALAGPAIEGIAQLATQAAKNNAFEGTMSLGSKEDVADFQRYAKWLEENPDIVGITLEEWKQYDNKLKEYNGEGGSCQRITPAMLGGLTVEEYMKQNGVSPAGAPPEKPKSKGSNRAPTKEEEEALKNLRLM